MGSKKKKERMRIYAAFVIIIDTCSCYPRFMEFEKCSNENISHRTQNIDKSELKTENNLSQRTVICF